MTNAGNAGAAGVGLVETIPGHTSFEPSASSAGWTCSPSTAAGSACTLSLGTLAGGGGSAARTFAVRITNPLPAGVAVIDNTACVTMDATTSDCDTLSVPTSGAPSLSIDKQLASGSGEPGSLLLFELVVQNTGTQGTSVVLEETVPENTSFDPLASSPGWSCSPSAAGGASCTLAAGTLDGAGATLSRLFAVRVRNPLPAGVSSVRNVSCARWGPAQLDCDEIEVPTAGGAQLRVTKSLSDGVPQAGGRLTYRVRVENVGNQDAASITLNDSLPAGTTLFAPTSPGWSCSAATCSSAVPSLAAGAAVDLTLAVDVANPLPAGISVFTNTACATAPGLPETCSSVSTPRQGGARLTFRKDYDGPPLVAGALLRFDLTVSNEGDQDAAAVILSEEIPPSTSFVAEESSPGWSCQAPTPGSSCSLTLPELAAGASATLVFAVRVADPLPVAFAGVVNTACARMDDSGAVCDTASPPLPVFVEASLTDELFEDLDGDMMADAGEVLRYVLEVSNPSSAAASDVTVRLELDALLALVAGSVLTDVGTVVAGNGPADTTVAVTLPSLAPGATVTIAFLTRLSSPIPPGLVELVSQAFVDGSNILSEPSDDPETPTVDDDPTVTALTRPVALVDIPTIGEVGALLLAGLLCLAGLRMLRRTQEASS